MSFDPKVLAIAGSALGFLYIMAVEPLNPKTKRQENYNPDAWRRLKKRCCLSLKLLVAGVFGRGSLSLVT